MARQEKNIIGNRMLASSLDDPAEKYTESSGSDATIKSIYLHEQNAFVKLRTNVPKGLSSTIRTRLEQATRTLLAVLYAVPPGRLVTNNTPMADSEEHGAWSIAP